MSIAVALALGNGRTAAAGENPCAHIDRLLQEAATDFQAIARPSAGNATGVSLVLPGAKECTLRDSAYGCEWVVESPDKGIEEFEVFAASLAQCLKPKKFEIERQPGFFNASRPGVASVIADWSRDFLTIQLHVEKEK
jgi:hypothetical protein